MCIYQKSANILVCFTIYEMWILKYLASLAEDSVCHEFAALSMSNMATEFSSKAAIFDHSGVEPLVRCMMSNDPDVQKNSIEALALLLMVGHV